MFGFPALVRDRDVPVKWVDIGDEQWPCHPFSHPSNGAAAARHWRLCTFKPVSVDGHTVHVLMVGNGLWVCTRNGLVLLCVVCCVVSCRAWRFTLFLVSSTCRSPVGPLLCPLLRDFPKFAGLCTAPPGPRPAPHIAPRTGTPRRLAHLFQAWLSYSPNLIRRYVGKMCPSRVSVLHLTHTLLYSYLPLFLPLATVGEKRCSNLSKDPIPGTFLRCITKGRFIKEFVQ